MAKVTTNSKDLWSVDTTMTRPTTTTTDSLLQRRHRRYSTIQQSFLLLSLVLLLSLQTQHDATTNSVFVNAEETTTNTQPEPTCSADDTSTCVAEQSPDDDEARTDYSSSSTEYTQKAQPQQASIHQSHNQHQQDQTTNDDSDIDYHELATMYGVPQNMPENSLQAIQMRLRQTHRYMTDIVHSNTPSPLNAVYTHKVKLQCKNRDPNCVFWASVGECENNPTYMLLKCAPSCFSCEQLDFNHRCGNTNQMDESTNVWQAGDLHKMFQRITTDRYYVDKYHPTILCQPGDPNPTTGDSPWIVLLEDFVSDEECDALIQLGYQQGYERSEDVGDSKFDGTYGSVRSEGRTSENAWCTGNCLQHPLAQQVIDKIENLTAIPSVNSEHLQLLKYEQGQHYNEHHDYIPHHVGRAQGPRILTVFLYLNTVERGGGTHFTNLNITVLPKKGRAVIWPSVLDKNPTMMDHRTHHEAMPVEEGIKYGANAWVRMIRVRV